MSRNSLIAIGLVVALAILIGVFLGDQSSGPPLTDRLIVEDETAFGETVVADPTIVDVPQNEDSVEEQTPAQVWGIISTPEGGVEALAEVSIFRVRFPKHGWDGFFQRAMGQMMQFRDRDEVSSADSQLLRQPFSGNLSRILEPISQTVTDDHGRYQFHGLERGRYLVAATADGTLRTPAQQIIELVDSVQRGDVTLLPGASLSVRTLGADGVEQDCRVMVRANFVELVAAWSGSRRWSITPDEMLLYLLNPPIVEGRTDADGRVQFQHLMPLEYNVYVQKNPRLRASQQLTLIDSHEITIDLVPGAIIAGLIVTTEGSAVEGAVVNLKDPATGNWTKDPRPMPESVSDATGRFRIQGVPSGWYELEVKAKGHIDGHVSGIEVQADETIPVEVVLDPGAVIRGIVRDQAGSPLPGIEITSQSSARGQFARTQAHTDETGQFIFDTLEPGEFRLTFIGSGWITFKQSYEQRVETGPDLVEVTLERAPLVSGRVVTLQGEPIEGARIASRWSGKNTSETYSDSKGHFQLSLEGGVYSLSVFARGFAQFGIKIDETVTDLGDLVLSEAVTVEGRVLSPDGHPLSGARIASYGGGFGSPDVWSATDGSFLLYLVGVPPDPDQPLNLQSLLIASYPQLLDSDPVTVESRGKHIAGVELVLRWGAEVRGTVTGNGVAVAGASVTLNKSGRGSSTRSVRADEAGQFLVGAMEAGQYSIQASADGFANSLTEHFVLQADERRQIDIQLQAEAHLAGIVIDPMGMPVKGAKVTIRDATDTRRNDVTGVDGLFSIDQLALGPVDVMAESEGSVPSFLMEIDPAQGQVEIVMVPSFELRGIVVDRDTADPIPGARVSLPGRIAIERLHSGSANFPRKYPSKPRGRTGPEGLFSIKDLRAGRYEVRVEADGYVGATVNIDIPRDDRAEPVLIGLDSGGRVIVEVVDLSGAPVEGARVIASNLSAVENNYASSDSDRNGRATLAGLEDGRILVSINHAPYVRAHVYVELKEIEGSARVRVVLEPGATIRGQVRDASGNLVRAGKVSVLRSSTTAVGSHSVGTGEIDDSGNYSISGLRPGTYEVVFKDRRIVLDPAPRGLIEVTGTEVYFLDLRP
jgi:protocatechuate 3,4-dioxygenase beta subunit